jgi:hypothetical protein
MIPPSDSPGKEHQMERSSFDEWFDLMWDEKAAKQGITKERAREVAKAAWDEMDDIFTSAQAKAAQLNDARGERKPSKKP